MESVTTSLISIPGGAGRQKAGGRRSPVFAVLSVDAEHAGRMAERLAQAEGGTFAATAATSLEEARALMSERSYDAVVVGLDLPDSKGLPTAARVRSLSPSAAIIVMVAQTSQRVRRRALAHGADEIFARDEFDTPFFARSLLHVVERVQARVKHRELEKVLAAAPDAILVVGLGGEVKYVNQAALALFALQREDFVGERLGFSVRDGETSEVTIPRGDNQRLCEMRVVQIEWCGEPAFLASLRDITEHRQLEAQLAMADRMVSIGTLAAGVAHEINNPLAAIMANLDLAIRALADMPDPSVLPEDLFDELSDAKTASERVRRIVADLKLFSRSQADVTGPVDLHAVVESTIRLAWNEIRHRARLVKTLGVLPPVHGNEARLGQVVLNLLVNAAQALPDGNRDGNEIRVVTGTNDGGHPFVTISDTGCGMPPEVQKRLFTAFFTTKPVGSGTGLGLAISHRIVTSFGGRIAFESEVGKGTSFTVTLQAAEPAVAPRADLPDAAPVRPRRGGHVLVIDDDTLIGDLVKRILGNAHAVTTTDSAATALRLLQENVDYDIIFCDLMMPQMSGMDFYQELQRIAPGREERVVFMTGGAFTPGARSFLDAVANPRFEKPFDVKALRALVQDLLLSSRRDTVS